MISFPHAKINLGLSIISKRPDGFHNIETIFYPLPIRDVLEIVPSKETKLFSSGLPIAGVPDDNLVILAYKLIKINYPQIAPLEIYLHKSIPMGAGLGGGSSDAAGILHLMDKLFNLQISSQELNVYALKLGSDCPFFMQPAPCIAKGRGEILEPIALDLSAYSFILVHPDIMIETAWAYSRIIPSLPEYDLKESILQSVQNWINTIHNDFELPVFEVYPGLRKIKEKLYASGAVYAAMTGSGSTIFGIFKKPDLPVSFKVENANLTIIR